VICYNRFIDLDTPLLLSEDPVLEGYEGNPELDSNSIVPICFFCFSFSPSIFFVFFFSKSKFDVLTFCEYKYGNFFNTLKSFLLLVSGAVYKFRNSRGHGGFLHWDNIAWYATIEPSKCVFSFNLIVMKKQSL
jgi:hypothetical protein